jgi:hypothetical protein
MRVRLVEITAGAEAARAAAGMLKGCADLSWWEEPPVYVDTCCSL